jgi:hypothetical protein
MQLLQRETESVSVCVFAAWVWGIICCHLSLCHHVLAVQHEQQVAAAVQETSSMMQVQAICS